jgi:class 3 adenylate cyclase
LSIWQALDIFPNAPMPSEPTTDPKFEIGHVLFIDMVGYSQLLLNEQSALLDELNRIVRGTNQFREAENGGGLVRLPSGDGMALVFRDSPESPAQCALEIDRALRNHPRLRIRMGIHSGPVNEVRDVNETTNLAGAGINLAQRVMDCGDAGHILLSRRVADDLEPYAKWRPYLHDLGECQVKHGVRIQLVSLHNGDVGNSQLPKKLQSAEKRHDIIADRPKRLRRNLRWRTVGALVAVTAVLVVGILLLSRLFSTPKTAAPSGNIKTAVYASRSYENTKWSKIYGTDRLFPARASFQKVVGWDRKNLAITGTIEPEQLLLLLQNGEWKVNRLGGPGAISACRFANQQRVLFLRVTIRGMADLMACEGAAYQRLGTVPVGSSLYVLAPDLFFGMNERGGYWKYSGNSLQQFEKTARESLVLNGDNVAAQIKSVSRGRSLPMPVANVRHVTAVGNGKALGLWSTALGDCAVVRYRDGLWYLVNEIPGFSGNNVPDKAWFVDEKNFVAIGSDKVARSFNGKVDFQALLIGGQEYPAKELVAVWGRDLNNYWTADLRGNVFHFDGTQWRLIVRGPDFKTRQKFEALWPAPDGSVIAVTKDEVYVLE